VTEDTSGGQAIKIVHTAGKLALDYFGRLDTLEIDSKGHQDFVTEADREVELAIRGALADAFPDDAIVGEEHAAVAGTSGFTWVIDPIDGTANFVADIPAWTVVLAGVSQGKTQVGIIHDPCHGETFVATRGGGARLNGRLLSLQGRQSLNQGTVCIGFSNRREKTGAVRYIEHLFERGGIFCRNGSGALSLAYVAAGRFLGYAEQHMNAWDCLAGQLIVAEAGGRVEDQNADEMISRGGRVIAGAPDVFDQLVEIADAAYSG